MSTPQKAPHSISTIYRLKAGTVPIIDLSEEKIKQILNQIASGENMRRIPLNIFLNVFFPNK